MALSFVVRLLAPQFPGSVSELLLGGLVAEQRLEPAGGFEVCSAPREAVAAAQCLLTDLFPPPNSLALPTLGAPGSWMPAPAWLQAPMNSRYDALRGSPGAPSPPPDPRPGEGPPLKRRGGVVDHRDIILAHQAHKIHNTPQAKRKEWE